MRWIPTTIIFAATMAFVAAPPAGSAKTAKACNVEYKEQKDALKAAGTKKKDFITQCRAEPDPAPTPTRSPTTQPEPVPQNEVNVPPATGVPKVNEFAYEATAKGRCPSDTVVWVDTRSRVYHFAGTPNYGATQEGAYMCEADAAAARYRAAKNEKHP